MLRIINIGLRGLTLLSKFLLIFYLVIYLTPAELGLYGLIVTTIAYAIYPLGFEFYTYNVRELLGTENSQRGGLIKNQFALHLRLYLIFIPLFIVIFVYDFLPWSIAGYFFALLILEHLNQELFRLLIALSKQIEASICLFLRQGVWTIAVIILMSVDDSSRSLDTILIAWLIGSISSLLLGIYTIWKMPLAGWKKKVDWLWIRKGLTIATPLLIASLSLNAISTMDRYWFSFLQGENILGVYVFYLSLSASLLSFLDAGVFSFIYPKLVKAVASKNGQFFLSNIKKMIIQSLLVIIGFCISALALVTPLLESIEKTIYLENINLFYIALLSISVHGLSYVYHYALYAHKRDKSILVIHVFAILIFLASTATILTWDTLYAVPLSVLISYTFILIAKTIVYKSINPLIEEIA